MSTPPLKPIFTTLILLTILSTAAAQTCQTYKFPSTVTNTIFSSCIDLPVLNSYLHWTYTNTTNSLRIAYRHNISTATSSWIAWAINPSTSDMVGSQAFVAFLQSDGSVKAYTSPVTSTSTTLARGELSFPVGDVSGIFNNGEMIILASLTLPSNGTSVNQVWQVGPVSNGNPGRHALGRDNYNSKGTLDLLSGRVAVTTDTRITRRKRIKFDFMKMNGGWNQLRRRSKTPVGSWNRPTATDEKRDRTNKKTHGILNVVSWGLMMPIGFIIARYLKVSKSADPAWFYLHASCQSAAFIIGLAGFATGIKLGNESEGTENTHHRNIGITLVILATLQVLALFLRPKKDHKHRLKWTVYHRAVGYVVIILSLVNVFKGFGIIEISMKNRQAYVGVLVVLALVTAVLEVVTWVVVIRRGKREDVERRVVSGYGRQQEA